MSRTQYPSMKPIAPKKSATQKSSMAVTSAMHIAEPRSLHHHPLFSTVRHPSNGSSGWSPTDKKGYPPARGRQRRRGPNCDSEEFFLIKYSNMNTVAEREELGSDLRRPTLGIVTERTERLQPPCPRGSPNGVQARKGPNKFHSRPKYPVPPVSGVGKSDAPMFRRLTGTHFIGRRCIVLTS